MLGVCFNSYFFSVLDRWQGRCNPDNNTIDIVTAKVMSLHVTLSALFVITSQFMAHLLFVCSCIC